MKNSFCILSLVFLSIVNSGVLRAQEPSQSEGLDRSHKTSESIDLSRGKKDRSRAVDSTPRFTGAIIHKPFGSNKEWPYLKSNNKEYRLDTTDSHCAEQISQCETGDVCTVKGEVIEGAEPILKAKSVQIESYGEQNLAEGHEGGEVTTTKGCTFKRDNFNPAIGEAWKSPKGTVWGELELNADGSPLLIEFEKAQNVCSKKGGRMPTKEEWKELAGCFDNLDRNTTPFTRLNIDKVWASELQFQGFSGLVIENPTGRLFNIKTGGIQTDGFNTELAFVRCVGAHVSPPDSKPPYDPRDYVTDPVQRRIYGLDQLSPEGQRIKADREALDAANDERRRKEQEAERRRLDQQIQENRNYYDRRYRNQGGIHFLPSR